MVDRKCPLGSKRRRAKPLKILLPESWLPKWSNQMTQTGYFGSGGKC
jgi:hypothetical protein